MKKTIAGLLASVLLLGCLGGCSLTGSGSSEAVSVQSVGLITGTGSVGVMDRFAGKIVSGDTAQIKKDANKTVSEVKVKEGDWVKAGDVLFTYDTEALELSLEKLQLELEGYQNTVTSAQSEIKDLESQKDAASADNKLAYTLQIDAKNADISEAQYNATLKQREIDQMQEALQNVEVTSPIDGMVMSVAALDDSASSGTETGSSGDTSSSAFITVMDMATYRVEGTINEMNKDTLKEGMSVIVRSRIDETKTWKGTIASIDWEHPVTNSDNSNGGVVYSSGSSSDEMTTSTKYPFYVDLETTDDMIFGQHVYIEPDNGQEEEQPALMLPAYYVCDADSAPYVWAMSAKSTLEKRSVTLGTYDEGLQEYEILSGLTSEDYIATPADNLKEGMSVTLYDESTFTSGENSSENGSNQMNGGVPSGGESMTGGASYEAGTGTVQSGEQPTASGSQQTQTAAGASAEGTGVG